MQEPINYVTRGAYSGKNAMILAAVAMQYPSAEFLTFRQALSVGRCVRKGEHGTSILKIVEGKPDPVTGRTRKGPRGYTVFNIAQTDALPATEAAA